MRLHPAGTLPQPLGQGRQLGGDPVQIAFHPADGGAVGVEQPNHLLGSAQHSGLVLRHQPLQPGDAADLLQQGFVLADGFHRLGVARQQRVNVQAVLGHQRLVLGIPQICLQVGSAIIEVADGLLDLPGGLCQHGQILIAYGNGVDRCLYGQQRSFEFRRTGGQGS